jgi:NTE family protein
MQSNKIKLSFSGGGFRATFYCLGAYRRLVELGIHQHVSHISSVSGGSLAAGAIMVGLSRGNFHDIYDFENKVTVPLKKLGKINLRKRLMFRSLSLRNKNWKHFLERPRTRFSRLFPILLDEEMFRGKLMKELTSNPEWSCNATCLNTLKRFRFKTTDIYGNLIGSSKDINDISVAFAVAASAAFPLMFSPIEMDNKHRKYFDKYNSSYLINPETLFLTDGGVYDNLGSENILKENEPAIILDASASDKPWEESYKPGYFKLHHRILQVSLDQIVMLRRRLLYNQSKSSIQLLINKNIKEIELLEKKYCPQERPLPDYPNQYEDIERLIGGIRTDLDAFHDIEIDTLMWSGAVRMDLAIKSLFPSLIKEEYWDNIPIFPSYDINEVEKVLNKGQLRSYLKNLH